MTRPLASRRPRPFRLPAPVADAPSCRFRDQLNEDLTARENLVMFGRLLGLSRSAARSRCDSLLADFALDPAADIVVRKFSGGMRRRLDLVAELIAGDGERLERSAAG